MPNFSRGARAMMRNAPKPAWNRIPGQRTFCCCFTIRSGASIIGWFNFIFNSLYVGMLVFALGQTNKTLVKYFKDLETISRYSEATESNPYSGDDLHTSVIDMSKLPLPNSNEMLPFANCKDFLTNKITEGSCICDPDKMVILNSTRDCAHLPREFPPSECLCELGYISFVIMPFLYRSCAIPGVMIAISILWLTAVESRSIRYLRLIGFTFLLTIPMQIIGQLVYQLFANKAFKQGRVGTLHPIVWIVYGIYTILNIYYLPVLYKYIKLRTKECAQGIEQGLLTSERNPPSNDALDVYLQDAFSIDDIQNNRIRYTIDEDDDDDDDGVFTKIEYEHKSSRENLSSSSDLPV